MRSSWPIRHWLDGFLVEKQPMIRRKSHGAVLGVGLLVAMTASARAQSWNLYNGDTSIPTISFTNGPMSPTKAAKVDLELGNASKPTPFVMDTGSTGIVVTPDHFTPGPNDVYVGQGSQTYTSSGKVENGSFYLTNVVIYQNSTTPIATAQVTILEVTSITCLQGHPKCKKNLHPTGVAYMGVGFDRGASSTQPPAPYNNTNPFINIVSLASGQPVSSLAPGYVISNSGVTLGLSASATNNFAFVKLLPNTTNNPPEPAPAWNAAPVTILVGGKQSSGTILPDSGIDYAYLTPPPGASITTTTKNPSCKSAVCLKSGNTIQVYLPGQTIPQPAFYTFTTGAPGNALEPNSVSLNKASTTAFLNTGREFYAGFDYVYDPINGYVGYRWNGTVSSSFGQVTPSVALTGNVNLPAGFANSLPTILYGPTTLLEAGAGTISNTISGSFGLTIGSGQVALTGANTYTGATNVTAGTLIAGNNAAFGSGFVSLAGGTTLSFMSGSNFTLANNFQISGDPNFMPPSGTTQTISGAIADGATPGFLNMLGPGTMVLSGANTYSGGTTVSAGRLQIAGAGTLGATTGTLGVSGGILDLGGTTQTTGALTLSGGVIEDGTLKSSSFGVEAGTVSATLAGAGALTKSSAGTVILSADNAYTGGTFIRGGTLAVGNNNSLGTGPVALVDGATLAFTQSGLNLSNAISLGVLSGIINTGADTDTLSGVISGRNDLTKIGTGTLILTGANTYIGPTGINAGTLDVTGSIAKSSLTTVASGATLTGTGAVGAVQVNSGGTLLPGVAGSPGTSLAIAGNLAFASGAIYLVQINPSSPTSANVSGTATLTGAAVNAQFAPGNYVTKQYDVLHASGGLNGTFASLGTASLPAGFTASLNYSATDAFLDLTATLGTLPTDRLTINERNVATALNSYFNSGGALPANFLPVFGLTGGALANTLMHLDGEVATGGEVAAFQLMDEFLNLMLDPFVDGRLGSGTAGFGGGPTMSFAPDAQTILPPDVALAYAGVLKAPPAPTFQQRWTAWAASYGGASTSAGDPSVGSSNLTAQTFGFAAGMDYHYSPDTIIGFALGGGGTDWGLAGGMGTGRSDAFQTGVYGITRSGPAYLGGAFAFANHWMNTSRATMSDILNASFDAQSYGARVEGGYRFAVLPTLGVSPYAAVQAQAFHTPSYSEADVTGGGFGLSYAAMNATDTRTELGSRFDDPAVIGGIPVLLRGRLAWAHDFVSDPALSAAFQSLPGSTFIVNGAPIPHDSALTSAGAEFFFTPRWTFLVKFDGAFAPGAETYAGSGTLRYSW
jgi:autotransporter-associated beta strand protein